jgi:hypothetical protein
VQAAVEKREKQLEHQIKSLKERLNNDTLRSLVEPKKPLKEVPAATGTFAAHLEATKTLTANVADSNSTTNKTEPMKPILKDETPKPNWPSLKSVAAPVAVAAPVSVHVLAAAAPPKKETIPAPPQKDDDKLRMNSAFTGTPGKKVASVLALEASVSNAAVPDAPAASESFSLRGWFSRAFAKLRAFWGGDAHVASDSAAQHKGAAFLDTTQRHPGRHEIYERTAQATKEESNHIFQLSSVWGDLEDEDVKEEARVRSEDRSGRERAETREAPHKPTKAELTGRHGADMSGFWGKLEKQDAQIERSIKKENLGEYERLTQEQDGAVKKAANQLKQNELHTDRKSPLKRADNAFLAKSLHDTWEIELCMGPNGGRGREGRSPRAQRGSLWEGTR